MRSILLIGDPSIDAFARALERDGFEVSLRPPGSKDEPTGEFALVVIHLDSAAEDEGAKRYIAAETPDAPPVICIVAVDALAGLEPAHSSDDFVLATAPGVELCARVRQVLWRRHGVDARNVLKCGDLEMDLANYTVQVSGRPVELTYKEYELLRFLATNPDRVFNRETLLNKVWGYDFYGGARTVDVHIRRLRSKIEEHHRPFIDTVRNVGYRFRAVG